MSIPASAPRGRPVPTLLLGLLWALLLTLPVSLATAGAAAAQAAGLTDGQDDVWTSTDGGKRTLYEGSTANSDLVSGRVAHDHQRMVLRGSYDRLAKKSTDEIHLIMQGLIDTGAQLFVVAVVPAEGTPRAEVYNSAYKLLHCQGSRASVSWKQGRIKASVPRTCLGEPKNLRWTLYSIDERTTTGHVVRFFDDLASGEEGPQVYQPALDRG